MLSLGRRSPKTFMFWAATATAGLALYLLVLYAVYQRERLAYDHQIVMAGYRLEDAEEQRRLTAEKLQFFERGNAYMKDPEYRAAQASVEKAVNGYPSDANLRRLKANEARLAQYGLVIYAAALVAVAIVRRPRR